MALSLFGKRASGSGSTDEGNDSQSRGLLDRMKQAVARTRDSFSESIGSVLALAREVDEASLAELETVLLAADIGTRDRAQDHRGPADSAACARELRAARR